MAESQLRTLYESLRRDNYDVPGTYESFERTLTAPGKEGVTNRQTLYNSLHADGYDVPDTYESFSNTLFVPQPKQQTAPVSQAVAEAPAPIQKTQAAAKATAPVRKAQPQGQAQTRPTSQQPTGTVAAFKLRRGGHDFYVTQQEVKEAGGLGAWAAKHPGAPVRVYMHGDGFTGHVDLSEASKRRKEKGYKYTLEYRPGHKVRRNKSGWVDNLVEYGQEAKAIEEMTAPTKQVVEQLWSAAEKKQTTDARNNYDALNNKWSRTGDDMPFVDSSVRYLANETDRMKNFDLDKMSDEAWRRSGAALTQKVYQRLKLANPKTDDSKLIEQAEAEAWRLTNKAVYDYAVEKNMPKSALEYFFKKVMDQNSVVSLLRGTARSMAGTTGDRGAYEAAQEEYGKKHKVADIAGTVAGMTADPMMTLTGGAGGAAGKAVLNVGGRLIARKAAGTAVETGTRLFANKLVAKGAAGVASGSVNLGMYEGLKEGERQFLHGGSINPETGQNEGYSLQAMFESAGKGAILGAATGVISPIFGNVGNKLVGKADRISSTGGGMAAKAGIRATQHLVATGLEGTIFATEGWLTTDEDKMDVWLDSMATMIGFKGHHIIRSAPRVIAGMRPVKPAADRPLTMDERNFNRKSFVERVIAMLDGPKFADERRNGSGMPLSFTKDDISTLKEAGYGSLADIFRSDRAKEADKPFEERVLDALGEDESTAEVSNGSGGLLDGYSEMEKLVKDANVPQEIRAKAYYALTGHCLGAGTITGHATREIDDGRIVVDALTNNGEIVYSRYYKSKDAAKAATDKLDRQIELNKIDVGEQYADAVADEAILDDIIKERYPDSNPEEIKRIYYGVKSGRTRADEHLQKGIDAIDKEIEARKDEAADMRPDAIRKGYGEEYGVDIDDAIRKPSGDRSETEKEAVESYIERLFASGETRVDRYDSKSDSYVSDVADVADVAETQPERQPIGRATMKFRDRPVEVLSGRVVMTEDGKMVDVERSDKTIVVRDPATGKTEMVSPEAMLSYEDVAPEVAAEERPMPKYSSGLMMILDNDGKERRGFLTGEVDDQGRYEYYLAGDLNHLFYATEEELDSRVTKFVPDRRNDVADVSDVADEKQNEASVSMPTGVEAIGAVDVAQSDGYGRRFTVGKNENGELVVVDERGYMWAHDGNGQRMEPYRPGANIPVWTEEQLSKLRAVQPSNEQPATVPNQPETVPTSTETPEIPTENAVSTAETVPNPAAPVDNVQETPAQSAELTPLQGIPLDEKGEPIFEQAETPEIAWDALVEFSDGDVADAKEMADIITEQKRKALEKLQKQKPKGNSLAELRESQKVIKAAREQAEQEYNFWQQMAGVEQLRQEAGARRKAEERAEAERAESEEKKRKAALDKRLRDTFEEVKDVPEAVEVLEDMDPRDIYEAAAQLLSGQKVLWGDSGVKVGARSETGFGEEERRRLFGLFASEANGGKSLSRLAEDAMKQQCETYGIPYDNQDARNALIEVVSGARTVGDIRNYIANNRIDEARRLAEAKRRHEEEQYDEFCRQEYHLTSAEVQAYEEQLVADLSERDREFDANEYNDYIAEEMARAAEITEQQKNGTEDNDARRGSTPGDRRVQENDTEGKGSVSGRGDEVLLEPRADQSSGAAADGGRPGIQPTYGVQGDGAAPAVAQGAQRGGIAAVGRRKADDSPYGGLAEEVTSAIGPFGKIYTQFRGKPREAVTFLLAKRDGEAIGALNHKDVGEIDLVWGDEGSAHSDGFGLAKLAKYHPEVLFNLQEILNDMAVTRRSANRVQLESEKYKAAVRLTWDNQKKTWLLTMFEKKNSVLDNTTDTDKTHKGNGNDTATPENTVVSDRKDIDFASDKQANGEESLPQFSDNKRKSGLQAAVEAASAEVNTEPTEAQKKAGNYKKGHVTIGSFDITIENPAGSVRRGVDADGKEWSTTMANAYGEIRGTQSVDGDPIDVFLASDMDAWNGRKVFVVDQTNADGSFDEHKVMLGFNDKDEAMAAYLANYDKTWADTHPGLRISEANIEDFQKWVESSHRKTKAFADYSMVKGAAEAAARGQKDVAELRTERPERGANYDMQKSDLVGFAKKFKDAGTAKISEIEREISEWMSMQTAEDIVDLDVWMLSDVCNEAGLDRGKAWAFRMSVDHSTPKKLIEEVFKIRNRRRMEISRQGIASRGANDVFGLERLEPESQKAVLGYLLKWGSAPICVVSDMKDILSLGLPQEVNAAFEDVIEAGNIPALFNRHDKKVYIFATLFNGFRQKTDALLHENIHGAIDECRESAEVFLGSFHRKVVESGYEAELFRNLDAGLKEEYAEDSIDEEFMAYTLPWMVKKPEREKRIMKLLSDEEKEFINNNILNKIRYAQRRRTSESASEESKGHETLHASRQRAGGGDGAWISRKATVGDERRGNQGVAGDESRSGDLGGRGGLDQEVYEAAKELLEAAGVDVVEVSDTEAAEVLNKRGSDVPLMGSRTDRKMAKIAEHFEGKELDENQQAVVDVFSGKRDNVAIEVERPDGKRRVVMRQGSELKAGVKYSLFRHYDTHSNYITADDVAMMPEIIAKGDRSVNGKNIAYDYTTADGTRLRVTAEKHGINERFTNLLSNREPRQEKRAENTQSSAPRSGAEVSDAKVDEKSETDKPQLLKTSEGVVYGWTVDGKVYLNRDAMNPQTPLHEYTHLWDEMVRRENPELWERGKELMKQTPLWQEVMDDPNYADICDDEDAVASEVHSRLTGKRGAERMRSMIDDARKDGPLWVAEKVTLVERLKWWLREMFKGLKATLEKWSKRDLHDLTAEQFADMTLRDLADGVNPQSGDRTLVAVHNISESKLKEALGLGGLPMPSIAVTKASAGHGEFGEISLVFGKESIDPSDRRNKVYSRDAWTPTFPVIGYKLNSVRTSEIYKRANKAERLPLFRAIDFHPDNYERRIEGGEDSSLVEAFMNDYSAKQLYLSEKGNAVTEYERHDVEKYTAENVGMYEKMLEQIGVERLRNESYEALLPELKKLIGEYRGKDFDSIKPFVAKTLIRGSIRNAVDYADNGNLKTETDIKATEAKIDGRIDRQEYRKWLEDLFAGVVEKKGIRNDRDMFTPSGSSRKWESLYDAVTLENVVKAMQRQAQKGGEGFFGSSIFGASAKELKSIDDIRREAAARISSVPHEEYEAEAARISARLEKVSLPSVSHSVSAAMDFVDDVKEVVSKTHTSAGIYRYLKNIYPDMTMDIAKEIADIVSDIQKMSTRYFEAKPQRAVGFDEVKLAVVPEGTSAEIINQLESRGIQVRSYERGNAQQRQAIISRETSERGLRFHAAMARDREDFDAVRERAVRERGIVMPGLNEAEVRVVEVPRHDFTGTGKEALKMAEEWAKEKIVGMHSATDSRGDDFEYSISNDAVEKYVSRSATNKSENIGVHLAALKKLPEIISESIEAEVHPDYKKNDGIRTERSEVNAESLVHRFYGAANIDGALYRVKTTMREYKDINRLPLAHSFEVTEIELLKAPSDGVVSNSGEPLAMTSNSSKLLELQISGSETSDALSNSNCIDVAKLLQGVEKSYDPGKKLLDESAKGEIRYRQGDGYEVEVANESNSGSNGLAAVVVTKTVAEMPEAKRSHAEKLAKKFNTPITIVDDVEKLPAVMRNKRGGYDVRNGNVIVVIPNHADVEDVAETVFHEVVAHKGLREMLGEENHDAFCDEIYGHLKDDLKRHIDTEAGRRFMREPEKGYEHHRRVAVDELFGHMAEKGFEDFTNAERGIWAKLKAKVLEAINKFLGSLKLPKWVRLGDNELRYILWRSHERLGARAKAQGQVQNEALDFVDMARDVAKRAELGLIKSDVIVTRSRKTTADMIEESFDAAVAGELIGKPVEIGRLTKEGREYLEKLSGLKLKEVVSFVLNPSDLVHMYRDHFGTNEKDKGNNIPLTKEDIRAIADVVSSPERVIFGKEPDGLKRNLFYFLAPAQEGAYNLLEIYGDRKGNLTAKTFYKTRKGVSQRVLSLMKSEHLTSVTDGATLSDGAKLPKFFDNSISGHEMIEYRFRDSETGDIWKDQSIGLKEKITYAALRLSKAQADDLTLRNDAMAAIGDNLKNLLHDMRNRRGTTQKFAGADHKVEADIAKAKVAQLRYDRSTVKRVGDLARILMQTGYLSDMTSGEILRLMSAVKNSVGGNDIESSVDKIMDIMIGNQLRNAEDALHSLLSIRGSKVDSRGVEVQGELDIDGQRTIEVVKRTINLNEDDITSLMEDARDRMGDSDKIIADNAAIEYAGLNMALDYAQNIANSKAEENALRYDLKTANEDKKAGRLTENAYKQLVNSIDEAIRKNKIERAEAYFNLVGRLSGSLRESIENARAFRESEKARISDIHHNANSDMEGRPSNEHHKDDWKDKMANNGFVQFVLAPLGTFDQILRTFGNKSANGEGYLWNRFMRGWVDCRNKELLGVKNKFARLDEKVAEIFGILAKARGDSKKGPKVKSMADMIKLDGKLPTATVKFWDGGEMREHELTQGNLLYIYMVDKMTDGRMKLRRMGITEEDIANVEKALDPRFKEFGDWLQEEFLVDTRNEYNETHKRMFGASMAAVENYFPLKILSNARTDKEEDVNQQGRPDGITTKTGSIIKRRTNSLALDIIGSNALSVVLDHITEMEHWNAYAEWNRDLNTLRTYKRFRNQVMNMTTAYGGGERLWKRFNDLCLMASGEYRPPIALLDKAAVNIAKGVTAAKVSFRIFTALKQFLSAPAYLPEVSTRSIAKSLANPYGDFKWCMENLPIFYERWHSRISGDPRLLKTDHDWKTWREGIVAVAARLGMTPNAFVDALTVSIGARAMYQTRLKRYLKEGYRDEEAEKRAKQDATILFNQTQQSSESPFLSTMQVDRSWLSVLFTVFRNSSMSYTRQEYDALRNLKRNLTPGQRTKSIEFMTKQILRDWDVDPDTATDAERDQAQSAAKKRFRRQLKKDVVRLATFGFILQLAWNLGAYLPYIIFGDDDNEKDKMWDDALTHSYFGSVEGLTGGDVMSSFGNMWASGEWNDRQLTKDMPLASDISTIINKFVGEKNSEAINDIINLTIQSGIGVNPQSITDIVVAITDACGDDPRLSHEAAICIMRILQVPQSQLDKMYFDEVGLSGKEISQYTPGQLAQRYAEYKIVRGTPFVPWTWGDEEQQSKYEKSAQKKIKERLAGREDDEVVAAYEDLDDRYKSFTKKISAVKEMMGTDYIAAAQEAAELQNDPDFKIYQKRNVLDAALDKAMRKWAPQRRERVKDLRLESTVAGVPQSKLAIKASEQKKVSLTGELNRIANKYFTAETPEEARLIAETMAKYRALMVDAMQTDSEAEQAAAISELSTLIHDFRAKEDEMRSTKR